MTNASAYRPKILIVDDEPFNIDYLEQELEDLGYGTVPASDGGQALQVVASEFPDMILLDIMMPVMNGFEVLARLKANESTRHIPVVIISANSDTQNIARGIEMGAEDYLPKPFDPIVLRARLSSGLERKRLRDLELEYLEQVAHLTTAAADVENGQFRSESLEPVMHREDALGQLARVFQRMALEVYAREQRLKHQIEQLRLDMEEQRTAAAETAVVYLPMDRRQELAGRLRIPERTRGVALLADISGFTPLTAALASELGLQRGAEELLRHLDRIFGALIDQVHRYGGSVINFSGDALTCWFDEALPPLDENGAPLSPALRGLACALAMQSVIQKIANITTSAGVAISIAIKVTLASGPVRRFLVGDPAIQKVETLGGQVLDRLALGDHLAEGGQILAHELLVTQVMEGLSIHAWRQDETSMERFAVVAGLTPLPPPCPWQSLDAAALAEALARPWLLPPVYERVRNGKSLYLAELRTAAALMLKFSGIDYDYDDQAALKLDRYVSWVQALAGQLGGSLIQLTIGDKGSYLYLCFGAPIAHDDDAARAVEAALALRTPPAELSFIHGIQIGLAQGQMRAGAYGGAAQRVYGVLGEQTNLAARLMQAAVDGILCDTSIYAAARRQFDFIVHTPVQVKGKTEPLVTYRPLGRKKHLAGAIDALPPELQSILKVASVIGPLIPYDLLQAVYPVEDDCLHLDEYLQRLESLGLIQQDRSQPQLTYLFTDHAALDTIYNQMLFSHRRQLHRAIAEWIETAYAADLSPYYLALSHHWYRAEDAPRAARCLELAGESARDLGHYAQALQYFNQSLALEDGSGLRR